MKLQDWDFQVMEASKGHELIISEAMLTSLKIRGLLTVEQVRECLQKLEEIYYREREI